MLEETYTTLIHSFVSVSVLFIFTRIMGKKQIAQLTFFDYVIGISIGSIAAQSSVDPDIHFTQGVTGLAVFTLFSITLSHISLNNLTARKILDGSTSVLIEDGKIIESNLKKNSLTVNDLLEECRQKDAFNIADVQYAILETNGKLSVMLNPIKQPITFRGLNIIPESQGLCVNLIIDGKIMKTHLSMLHKDEGWLKSELKKQKIYEYSDVLLAFVDNEGSLNVHLKKVTAKTNLSY